MKKFMTMAAAAALTFTSCGGPGTGLGSTSSGGSAVGNVLGDILGAATSGETLGNILTSVIGLDRVSQENLYGTWRYHGPGCAFTSENALAKAGGEVAATEVRQKLAAQYEKIGFSSGNTFITFNDNHKFSAKIDGKSWGGTWSFDKSDQSVSFQGLLLNLKGYVKRNGNGSISILFESKKILTLFQTMAALRGNSTMSAIGDISKNYDGVRIGFEMKK